MNTEFTALLQNGTWNLSHPRPNINLVGSKWVFRIKRKADGSIERYKARLIAKGFHQQHAVSFSWNIRQLDVTKSFLHGTLTKDVYMTQPPGFTHPSFPNHICHLKKAIYDLKKAPGAWYSRLSTLLLHLCFVACKSDTSVFIYHCGHDLIMFLIYVEDIIITGPNSPLIDRLITTLQDDFAIKNLGPIHFFLGVEAINADKGLYVSQRRISPIPLLSLTRPNIAFAVNKACQYMTKPADAHWSAVKRILRYLKHTISHCLLLHRDAAININAFSDANWVGCP
uniref:Reverse transcriptase Ty1/copia-type domain-containing protein n=1 Tax=Fagus sylvatica TaxID=28930 RepID=A0A2N9ENS9_FAGSY